MTDPQPCAGGIVFDAQRRLLVIQRGRPPAMGRWSIPGGRCHEGEPPADACVREVREETGLDVRVIVTAGEVTMPGPGDVVYAITDFACELTGGVLRAGDDAMSARWASMEELARLDTVPGLIDALADWGLLPD